MVIRKSGFGGRRASEVVVESKERKFFDSIGLIWFSEWNFKKLRLYRDCDGNVVSEMPFEETLFSLSKKCGDKWNSIWLRADEVRDLKNLLAGQEALLVS